MVERHLLAQLAAIPVADANVCMYGSVGALGGQPPRATWPLRHEKRFDKYGLTVQPEKTRLIPFRRPPTRPAPSGQPPADPPGTFDLLDSAHYWACSRKGSWVVKRKTAPSRFTRAVTKTAKWCQIHRHHPIAEQHQTLSQKLRGHFAYYGITGNSLALARFRQVVQGVWWKRLGRRRGGNRPTWAKFLQFEQRWLLPIALHSVCRVRSQGVTEEPYAVIPHVRVGGSLG